MKHDDRFLAKIFMDGNTKVDKRNTLIEHIIFESMNYFVADLQPLIRRIYERSLDKIK